MAGKVIGTSLNIGYPGNVSRMSDAVIMGFPVGGSSNIKYGEPVSFDPTTGKIVAVTKDTTGTTIIGFAVRRVGQPYVDSEDGWYYKPGDVADVLVRGSIVVEIETATGIAARGGVYLDTTTGKITSVSTSNTAIPNAIFSTGKVDANKTVEVTVTERGI